MCDPVSALIVASTAAAAAGQGVSAAQSAAMHRYEARIADRNAGLANEQARDAQERSRLELQRHYRKVGQTGGAQIAAQAANGIDVGSGSALQVQRDAAMIGAEDAAQLLRKGDQEVRGFDINASNYRSKAIGSRQSASNAVVKGVFDVTSTVLGGATQFSKARAGR